MRLAVFDIDGTLIDTCALDAECFTAAVTATLGIPESAVDMRWQSYPHITDSGVAATLVERHLDRAIEPAELVALESAFVELLTSALDRAPQRCRALPGAVEFLGELMASGEWEVALATGGFRRSALLKLMRAGFDPPPVLATSGEAISRADIVRAAIRAAGESAKAQFQSIVLLGDAHWDILTSRELDLPCVGIADGVAAAELLAIGAVAVLGDYTDREHAHRVVATAAEGAFAARE